MNPIAFVIDIEPRGKGRPRATIRGKHAATYTDAKTRNWEASFAALAEAHRPRQGVIDEPLRVKILAEFPRTQAMCQTSKRDPEKLLGGHVKVRELRCSMPRQ